jgi:hypothetical protein
VNIFDAMDALKNNTKAPRFKDIPALRNYCVKQHKVIPRAKAKAGGALRDLLRRLF